MKIFVQHIYKIRYYTEVRCFQLTHEVQRQKEIDVLIVAQFKISPSKIGGHQTCSLNLNVASAVMSTLKGLAVPYSTGV